MRILDVNTASLDELSLLRGVGTVTAQRIIDSRPYERVEQLVSRGVLTENSYSRNADYLVVEATDAESAAAASRVTGGFKQDGSRTAQPTRRQPDEG